MNGKKCDSASGARNTQQLKENDNERSTKANELRLIALLSLTNQYLSKGNISEAKDILAKIACMYPRLICVGFAAETENIVRYAKKKLKDKKISMIIANDVSNPAIGFNSDYNQVTFITKNRTAYLQTQSKTQLAQQLMSWLTDL